MTKIFGSKNITLTYNLQVNIIKLNLRLYLISKL